MYLGSNDLVEGICCLSWEVCLFFFLIYFFGKPLELYLRFFLHLMFVAQAVACLGYTIMSHFSHE